MYSNSHVLELLYFRINYVLKKFGNLGNLLLYHFWIDFMNCLINMAYYFLLFVLGHGKDTYMLVLSKQRVRTTV